MEEKIKKGLLIFMFIVLFLPYLQQRWPVVDSGVLQGYFTNADDIELTWNNWFDGTYQSGKNNFYNDHIGFRQDLVRLNSQIDYSLFQKLDFGGTTLGSDHYLYYDNYIDAYYGRDYAGYKALSERMIKLKALQDTFASLGKTLVLAHAPCKVWYYPEHVPTRMKLPRFPDNNYKTNVRLGDSLSVNQLDFNAWFLSMKSTAKEPLYSRQGIHWTNYGAILAADSLVSFIERLRHIRMPHPQWKKTVHTTEPQQPDNDMAVILNLFLPITTETFCYPELFYDNDTGITKPKMIFIGDSYNINLVRTGVMKNISSEWQFWFGFKNVLNEANHAAWAYIPMAEYDWRSQLKTADCIVIMNTPMNAGMLAGGFIDQAYDHYFPKP